MKKIQNMKNIIKILPICVGLSLLSGCASIIEGTHQKVSVSTSPVSKAICKLTNKRGTWSVKTPGTVSVHRDFGDLDVKCSKKHYYGSIKVQSSTQGAAFGNAIAGGFIGAGVDMADGAAYGYPATINVPMKAYAKKS